MLTNMNLLTFLKEILFHFYNGSIIIITFVLGLL